MSSRTFAVTARGAVLAMIALGIFLRTHAFGFPTWFLFDEHHFVRNARSYLTHRPDLNDHPPLGKLIIAGSIRLLGDNPTGWRAPALLMGALTVIAGAIAAARLFRNRDAGWLVAGLLCADGFLIAYSRAALLDGYLAACLVVALAIASRRVTFANSVFGGLLLGAACNLKFSGVAVLVPLLLAIALDGGNHRRRALLGGALVGTGVLTYTALFAYGLTFTRDAVAIGDVFEHSARLFEHHAALTAMDNPATSGWMTWALPRHPLVLGYAVEDGSVRALSTLGNLAVWWSSIALALAVLWTIAKHGLQATLAGALPVTTPVESLRPAAFVAAHGRAVVLTLSGALAFLAPWVMTHRDSYIYHFLPTYVGLVVILGSYTAHALRYHPLGVAAFTLLILTISLLYAPVWSFIPLRPHGYELRLFLPSWR